MPQVAITLTTLVTGYVAEPLLGRFVRPALMALGMSESSAAGTSLVVAMLLATSLSMVIGEMVPKNLAVAEPLRTARAVAGYHTRFSALFRWLINLMNDSANWVVRKFGVEPQEELRSATPPTNTDWTNFLGCDMQNAASMLDLSAVAHEPSDSYVFDFDVEDPLFQDPSPSN